MFCVLFFQAEDGIRDLVRSRGLGDVYKRQALHRCFDEAAGRAGVVLGQRVGQHAQILEAALDLSLIHI